MLLIIMDHKFYLSNDYGETWTSNTTVFPFDVSVAKTWYNDLYGFFANSYSDIIMINRDLF